MSIFELGGVVGTGMPLIGWHTFATAGNATVWDQTGDFNDASGGYGQALWDGTTYTKWRNEASTGDIMITNYAATGLGVNYMALAAHNFGTLGITASIEAASDATSYFDRSPTSLLHFENTGSPDIILDSTGRHTWTAVGNAFQDTAQFKFGTRSLRLDGTQDYVLGDGSLDFAFGTGDFTIDLWVRFSAVGANFMQLFDQVALGESTGNYLAIFKNTTDKISVTVGTTVILTSTTSMVTNTWFHVAVVRASGVMRLYINGAQEGGNVSNSTSLMNPPNRPVLGIYGNDLTSSDFAGWLDEVRVIKFAMNAGVSPDTFTQQTAAYPNEFVRVGDPFTFADDTPAIIRFPDSDDHTAVRLRLHSGIYEDDPVSGVTGTLSALLPFNGAPITDLAGHAWTVNGNGQIDTAQYRFGGASLLLDGTGDYLTGDGSNAFAFGTGDFTIDFWVRFASVSTAQVFYDSRPSATNGAYVMIYKDITTNVLKLFVNTANQITGTTAMAAEVWHHVAVTRTGTSTRLFLNGVQEGSTYSDSNSYLNGTSRPTIGAEGNAVGTNAVNGNIDEFRVIKGRAKWTANFTVPTRGVGFTASELYAGVQYVGNILELERSIDVNVDHVPMPYGRRTTVINGMSETGQFLGRVVLGEWRESKATFKWFTPGHYRADIDAFLEAAQETPFFWAWHPDEYPAEVSFAWLVNNAEPETDPVTQRVHLELQMRGTAP